MSPMALSCHVLMLVFIGGSIADPKIRTTSGSVEIDANSVKVGLSDPTTRSYSILPQPENLLKFF